MEHLYDYGILNTQADPRFGARRYGRFGNLAKNGCGMIALYNVERAARADTRFEVRISIETQGNVEVDQ